MDQLELSPVIVGAMRLGAWGAKMSTSEYEYFIDGCLDLGLKDFDHADIYGHYTTESEFGAVIKKRPDLKNKFQITTKCSVNLVCDLKPQFKINYYETNSKHILNSVDESLKNLGIDCIDLFLLHRPDYLLEPAEVAEALLKITESGKVKHVGVSNYSSSLFDLIHAYFPMVTNQIEMSLSHLDPLDDGTLNQCMKLGIQPTVWSPFGGGSVFDKTTTDEQTLRIQNKVDELAEKYNAQPDQIHLSWLMKHPSQIVPVIGTSKLNRVKTSLEAAKINLSHEDWYDLLAASRGKGVD